MQDGLTAHDVAVIGNNMIQAQIVHHFIMKDGMMKMEDRLLSRLLHHSSSSSSSNINNHNKRKYDCIIDDEKQDVL